MSKLILVSGASGQLGKLVVSELLELGTDPKSIVALVRSAEKGRQFESKGVQVRLGDYSDVASLQKAFEGVTTALLISSNNVGHRHEEHKAFIDTFKQSESAQFIAYTSIPRADTTKMKIAIDHKDTEELIKTTGLDYSFLRNSWYIENQGAQIHSWAQHGALLGASGQGRISAASRLDYAIAAAKVLTMSSPKKIYELGGKPGYTLDSLAESASKVLDKPIKAVHMPENVYSQTLQSFGLPAVLCETIADAEAESAKGALEVDSGDLQQLIGRESESVETVLQRCLKETPASGH